MKKIIFIISFLLITNLSFASERFIPLELFTGGEIRDDTEIKFTKANLVFGEKKIHKDSFKKIKLIIDRKFPELKINFKILSLKD